MSTSEKIKVMQAWENGEEVEFKLNNSQFKDSWGKITNPLWNWERYVYRIKPKPPLRIFVNVYENSPRLGSANFDEAVCKRSCGGQGKTLEFVQVIKDE